jgi:hypothetical protein
VYKTDTEAMSDGSDYNESNAPSVFRPPAHNQGDRLEVDGVSGSRICS